MSEKQKNLDQALLKLEKQFGKNSVIKLDGEVRDFPHIPTGIPSMDHALGIGGLPKGRIVEIYGPESSGKTSLTLAVIAEAQKAGGVCGFVDAEHALDPQRAQVLGVNTDELLVAQPDNGEQALEITEELVKSNALDVIVIDSVAALVPRAEIEGDMGDSHMGLQARLMSQAMRKLTGVIKKSDTIVIFINQIRMKLAVMFGSPETTTGGNALKFYASVRIDVRKIESLMNGDDPLGIRVRAKVVKNKVAPPFTKAEYDLLFDDGFSVEGSLLDECVQAGIVAKAGTWYSYGETRLGQGKEKCRIFLKENVEIKEELNNKLNAYWKEERDAKRALPKRAEVQNESDSSESDN